MYCLLMAFKSFLHILCVLVAAAVPVSVAPLLGCLLHIHTLVRGTCKYGLNAVDKVHVCVNIYGEKALF